MNKIIRSTLFTSVFASIALGVAPGFEAREAEASVIRNIIRRIWNAVTGGAGGSAVPELDPSLVGQAALIVLAGTAIALHRGRRNDKA